MQGAAIVPTVTHRVRGFLWAQGVRVKPWSGLEETYDALYELMRSRKDDPGFWPALAGLLRAIVESAAEPAAGRLPAPQAELLSSWDIDRLVADMRAALPEGQALSADSGRGAFRRFTAGLAAPVLGGFLLIGMVAAGGCGGETSTVGDTGTEADAPADTSVDTHVDTAVDTGTDTAVDTAIDTGVDAPWAEGCSLPPTSTLFTVLLEATAINDYEKQSLCTCFSGLNTSWNDGLVNLFATSSPDMVAAALYEMVECCRYDAGQLDSNFADVRDAFLDGSLCYVALPYRGVTFPER